MRPILSKVEVRMLQALRISPVENEERRWKISYNRVLVAVKKTDHFSGDREVTLWIERNGKDWIEAVERFLRRKLTRGEVKRLELGDLTLNRGRRCLQPTVQTYNDALGHLPNYA